MAKQQRKKFEGIKAITPTFRTSYMHVHEPKAFEDGEPKYSVEMLYSEKASDLTDLKKKMQIVAVKAWGSDKAKWPKNFRWPFKKGDEKDGGDDHYKGHVYARADSKQPPGVFDENKDDIIDKREFASGDYARASVFMVPYENIGGKHPEGRSGIKIYLQGIQRIKKGERFGNQGNRDDFEVVENEEAGETSDDTADDMGF